MTNKIIEKYIREKKCTCSLVDKKRKKQTTISFHSKKKRETKMMLEKRQKIFAFLLPPVYWLKLKNIIMTTLWHNNTKTRLYKNFDWFCEQIIKNWQLLTKKNNMLCVSEVFKKGWLFFLLGMDLHTYCSSKKSSNCGLFIIIKYNLEKKVIFWYNKMKPKIFGRLLSDLVFLHLPD